MPIFLVKGILTQRLETDVTHKFKFNAYGSLIVKLNNIKIEEQRMKYQRKINILLFLMR